MTENKLAVNVLFRINEISLEQYKDIGKFLEPLHKFGTSSTFYDLFLHWFDVAERDLKKPVVVAWFLKMVAIWYAINFCSQHGVPKYDIEQIKKKIHKLKKGHYDNINIFVDGIGGLLDLQKEMYSPTDMFNKLKHYFSFGYDEINGFNYTNKTIDDVFEEMESIVESKSGSKFFLNDSEEKNAYGNKIEDYLVFPNGWKWVWKHVYSCKDFESKYGGENHCGTAGSTDQELISLREPVGNGMYKIWATVSIDPEGYIHQFKGTTEKVNKVTGNITARYGNKKPEPFTHEYIVELLKYGNKKGDISGFVTVSDYLSENDFRLPDLEDKDVRGELEEILDEKETYESIEDEYENLGMTDRVRDEIASLFEIQFGEDSNNSFYNITEDNFGIFVSQYFEMLNEIGETDIIFPTKNSLYKALSFVRSNQFKNGDDLEVKLHSKYGSAVSHFFIKVIDNMKVIISDHNQLLKVRKYDTNSDYLLDNKLLEVCNVLEKVIDNYNELGLLGVFFKNISYTSYIHSYTTEDRDGTVLRVVLGVNDHNLMNCYYYHESEFDLIYEIPWDKLRIYDRHIRFAVSCSLYGSLNDKIEVKDYIKENIEESIDRFYRYELFSIVDKVGSIVTGSEEESGLSSNE